MKSAAFASTVDVRVLEPRFRHAHIGKSAPANAHATGGGCGGCGGA